MEVSLSKTDIQEIAIMVANILKPTIDNSTQQTITTYSPEEVASITKRNVQTIRIHLNKKILKGKLIGKNWIITQENLTKYINRNE